MSYRVVQWGTGNIGYQSLRHVIQHPDFELVGLHTFSPEKIGKDAGEIARLPEKTGIVGTNDIDSLLDLHVLNKSILLPDLFPKSLLTTLSI